MAGCNAAPSARGWRGRFDMTARNRITIAILALGGQGGGVLAGWIEQVARGQGWLAQGTSVPGVAQRTGSTVYYVELARPDRDEQPVMAQMPVPGDVDIVIASELMEAGRAMLRGFVSADRTTLIASTHRIYAIAEKSAMGDGRGRDDRIIEAAHQRARQFIGFDMDAATSQTNSVISAVMFGALAGSGALPFARDRFEQAIRDSGIAVDSNLAGFALGLDKAAAGGDEAAPVPAPPPPPAPTTKAGQALAGQLQANLPAAAHAHGLHGLARLMDYQDAAYAELYVRRLAEIAALDSADGALTAEAARHLALWMSYEDTIRVADLKVRASRFKRVREEVRAEPGQLLHITEFMHPRYQEVCETLPAWLGRRLLASRLMTRLLAPMFRSGRHVTTSGLPWFLALHMLAAMRRIRRATLRYREENARIEQWLADVKALAARDRALAREWVMCQRLIKGYGDTFERGLRHFEKIRNHFLPAPGPSHDAAWLRQARQAAMADDEGATLDQFLAGQDAAKAG